MPEPDARDDLPEGGPGLQASAGLDRTAITASAFALLCLTPTDWVRSTFQAHAFGPIQFTVILAIVAVIFGFVAILRSTETHDMLARRLGAAAVAIGLVRILIFPMLGL